LEQKSGTKHI